MKRMKILLSICLVFQVLSISAFAQSFKYHTVAPEENIYRIAIKYKISEEAIYKYNPDARNGVQVGSKIVIPLEDVEVVKTDGPVEFRAHKVERKETLFSLSQRYNVDIDDIKRYNKHLYSKELQFGETVNIPIISKDATPLPKAVAQKPAPVQITTTREHVILPKETKYGIARKYGMTVKELESLNPTVDELRPGIMLKVNTDVLDEPVIITNEDFTFYEVQPQETIFSLSRRFEIDQDSLIALNPALKDGLKYGMVLKVPAKDDKGKEIDITREIPGAMEEEQMTLERRLKDFSTKNIVVMLPFKLGQVRRDSVSNARDAILNDRVMRISLDFHAGVLMAVEKAKELGISTNLKVYDTQQEPSTVTSTILGNNFNNVDAVIGPLLQQTSEEAAARLMAAGVPVISPITNRELRSYSNLYQAGTSENQLREGMIQYLSNNSSGKNVIIIADGANSGTKSKLLNALPDARTVNPSGNNVTEGQLANLILKDRENWVILESESVALLSSATSALNRLARGNRIKLFTTNKNNSFESDVLSNEHLGRLNFHFPSDYKEYDDSGSNSFIDAYKAKYGVTPNKYTVRGYDLTLDVLLRLGAMGTLENSVKENILTEYVENKFLYRPKPSGGFYNDGIYIMRVNNDLTLSVAN